MFDATHFMKEEDFMEKCCYCGEKLPRIDWKTMHQSHADYKTIECACGKENKITLNVKDTTHAKWIEEELLKVHQRKEKSSASIEVLKHRQHPLLEERVEKNQK